MPDNGKGTLSRAAAAAVLAAWVALAHVSPVGGGLPLARAALPQGSPAFSDPLTVTNEFFPVIPGSLKVFTGKDGREIVATVETHLVETRDFTWNAQQVSCRVIREAAFVDGELYETSWNYYAQADDGSVYVFGEIEEAGAIPNPGTDSEGKSWVVGAVAPGDPPDTVSITDPTLMMPANPGTGDLWTAKSVPGDETETLEVVGFVGSLRVPAGRFVSPMRAFARTNTSPGKETKWFGRGVGEIQSRSRGEYHRLLASTLGTQ